MKSLLVLYIKVIITQFILIFLVKQDLDGLMNHP